MAENKQKQRKYATTRHPLIEAVVEGLFQLETKKQAEARMKELRDSFVFSRDQVEDEPEAARLWIRGYGLSDDEKKQGYRGHFGIIRIFEKDDGKWTLLTEKEDVPLDKHPQKERPKQAHPDWGHPLLREVKKGSVYESVDEAYALLEKLHVAYPETSIPGKDKLHIIIYQKRDNGPPIQKYTFRVELAPADKGNGFIVVGEENDYDKKKAEVKSAIASHAEEKIDTAAAILPQGETAQKGRFANMVELKRKKKQKRDVRAEAKKAGGPGSHDSAE